MPTRCSVGPTEGLVGLSAGVSQHVCRKPFCSVRRRRRGVATRHAHTVLASTRQRRANANSARRRALTPAATFSGVAILNPRAWFMLFAVCGARCVRAQCFMQLIGVHPLLAGKRVLVVDDEDDSREVLRLTLESRGMRVHDYDNAAEALAVLTSMHVDLMISDLGMPACDGYSLIRAVRSSNVGQAIPAVALSAFTREEDRARAVGAGFNLHLGKPFDASVLVEALASLLPTRTTT